MCDSVEFLSRFQMCFYSWTSYDQVTLPFNLGKVISLQCTEFPPETAIIIFLIIHYVLSRLYIIFLELHVETSYFLPVSVLEIVFPWD